MWIQFRYGRYYSRRKRFFVTHLLVKNPKLRYTAEQCLAHAWLQEKKMKSTTKTHLNISYKKLKSYVQTSRINTSGSQIN